MAISDRDGNVLHDGDGSERELLEAAAPKLGKVCLPGGPLQSLKAPGADLHQSDLSGADLASADLSKANLSHADLVGILAREANFS